MGYTIRVARGQTEDQSKDVRCQAPASEKLAPTAFRGLRFLALSWRKSGMKKNAPNPFTGHESHTQ